MQAHSSHGISRGHSSCRSTNFHNYKPGRILIGRLEHNDDLLAGLTEVCRINDVCSGYISVIGAVHCAKLGYYDQIRKSYTGCVSLNKKLEICSLTGNISFKDGKIFVHAHIVLADMKAKTYGGHLMPGARVFAAEYFIFETLGKKLHRVKDRSTGLPLWSF
jgi:predicted DNA-binding protein with PD1-like motif